ncbi:hypothetical protein [Streptomyces sp. NPDC002788]
MRSPVGGRGPAATGRAHAEQPHMSSPRAPEGDALPSVLEIKEFES